MKSLGSTAFVLLFVVLVVGCAFDAQKAQVFPTWPFQEVSAFCGALSGSILGTAPLSLPAHLIFSGEAIAPLPGVQPCWLLAKCIDHPPEESA